MDRMDRRQVIGWSALLVASIVVAGWVALDAEDNGNLAILFMVMVWCFTILNTQWLLGPGVVLITAGIALTGLFAVNQRSILISLFLWFGLAGAVGWLLEYPRRVLSNTPLPIQRVERSEITRYLTPATRECIEGYEAFLGANGFEPRPAVYELGSVGSFELVQERGPIRAVVGLLSPREEVVLELTTTLNDRRGLLVSVTTSIGFTPCDRVIRQRFPTATPEELLDRHLEAMATLANEGLRFDPWPKELDDDDVVLFVRENADEFLSRPLRNGAAMRRWMRTRQTPCDGSALGRSDLAMRITAIRGAAAS